MGKKTEEIKELLGGSTNFFLMLDPESTGYTFKVTGIKDNQVFEFRKKVNIELSALPFLNYQKLEFLLELVWDDLLTQISGVQNDRDKL